MINWKMFFTKDFWTKKEISYQYVHFTNSMLIVYVLAMVCKHYKPEFLGLAYVTGFVVGCLVELKQWIGGNHKVEDMIRDLVFWALGNGAGLYFYIK